MEAGADHQEMLPTVSQVLQTVLRSVQEASILDWNVLVAQCTANVQTPWQAVRVFLRQTAKVGVPTAVVHTLMGST